MSSFLPGTITGFREGLEAFLVVSVMLRYVQKKGIPQYKWYILYGVLAGALASFALGGILSAVSNALAATGEVAKIWESAASIAALVLITTFIIWMIKNSANITDEIKSKVDSRFSKWGVFWVAAVMIAREGAEVAIFSFTGQYTASSIFLGIAVSLVFAILIYFSLVKVNLKTIFAITLGYLILQAGFLLGYGIHEGLSALKDLGILAKDSFFLTKAFDLSNTILNHKQGSVGLPLFVLFGWYSKPEWIQLSAQYIYTVSMFLVWLKVSKNTIKEKM